MHLVCNLCSPSIEKENALQCIYTSSSQLESQNSPMSLCDATCLHSMRLTDAANMMRHRASWSVPILECPPGHVTKQCQKWASQAPQESNMQRPDARLDSDILRTYRPDSCDALRLGWPAGLGETPKGPRAHYSATYRNAPGGPHVPLWHR